mmetsp:Transcript_33698/g.54061  ORF Transcript_33698/g.54061 Transcript_33698/m.54061 type:complete len:234 (-) Transcript_33698:596-1297(-)
MLLHSAHFPQRFYEQPVPDEYDGYGGGEECYFPEYSDAGLEYGVPENITPLEGEQQITRSFLGVGKEEQENLCKKDAYWFLEKLEKHHISNLPKNKLHILEKTNLRSKAKHRNAILFQDDYEFIMNHDINLDREKAQVGDSMKIYLLHSACKKVITSYHKSIEHAPEKSCIWSALMHRVVYFLKRCNIPDVKIQEQVAGVKHKESTLFIQGYHISRSNVTKLMRQLIRKQSSR